MNARIVSVGKTVGMRLEAAAKWWSERQDLLADLRRIDFAQQISAAQLGCVLRLCTLIKRQAKGARSSGWYAAALHEAMAGEERSVSDLPRRVAPSRKTAPPPLHCVQSNTVNPCLPA